MRPDKTAIYFILILCLALFFRLQYLDKPLYRDEPLFFESAKNMNEKGVPFFCERCLDEHGQTIKIFNYHAPLFLIYLSWIVKIVGLNEFLIRCSIVIFSIASIFLTYLIGKEIGGRKFGLVASFLLSIARLHVQHSQVVDIDGSFFTFFILLSIFFIYKFMKSQKPRNFLLVIFSISIAILVKESAILLLPPLFIILYKKKQIKKFFETILPALTIVFVVIFLFSLLYSTNFFEGIFHQVNAFVFQRVLENKLARIFQFIGATTWDISLPLIILSIFSMIYVFKSKSDELKFLMYFVIFSALFYSAMTGITRYFVPIVPALCLLCTNLIVEIDFRRMKNLLMIFIFSAISLSVLFLLKVRTDVLFLSNFKSNLFSIGVVYILPIIFIPLLFTKYKKFSIIALFGLFIGYNLFFSQESVNPIITPNFNKAVIDAANFVKTNSIKEPILSILDVTFYSNVTYYDLEYPLTNLELVKNLMSENKFQYAIYRTDSLTIQPTVKEFLESNCKKINNGFSNAVEIFRIYKCH